MAFSPFLSWCHVLLTMTSYHDVMICVNTFLKKISKCLQTRINTGNFFFLKSGTGTRTAGKKEKNQKKKPKNCIDII